MRQVHIVLIFMVLLLNVACIDKTGKSTEFSDRRNDPQRLVNIGRVFERNRNIGRGMNFGNALEGPAEGDWGLTIQESYIQAVKDAGFNSVRLPVCWSAHTENYPPYTIDQIFLERVKEITDWCFDRDLMVIVTIHHFNDLYDYPDSSIFRSMYFAIWEQLTGYFMNYNHDKLIFEILNEPHNNLTADKWNALLAEILEEIRSKDTDRTIIIDVPDWAHHRSITKLVIPEEEKNAIISIRYYLPYEFTHQGAHWAAGSEKWLGTSWTGTNKEKSTVNKDLKFVKDWAEQHNRPITVGEFGSIIYADGNSRVTWTKYVRTKFEENGFSWCYFDFGVLFKVYNIEDNTWDEELRVALLKNR